MKTVEHFGIFNPFEPIFKPIIGIANAFLKIGEFIIEFVKLIVKAFTSASQILNPTKLINDIIVGVITGVSLLFTSFLEKINIFSIPSTGKDKTSCKNKKCYKLTFTRLMATIVCPPLGIFMEKGIGAFFQIILCALLTIYAYYFPGLIYALLHL